MRASCIAIVVATLTSCVTDAPAIPAHLDPASDQIAESPQPFERSLAGEVPPEARPLEERRAQPTTSGHQHGTEPGPSGQMFTCPMHPEVRQAGPGECPKCGMQLVAEAPPAGADAAPATKGPAPSPGPVHPAAKAYACPMHPEVTQSTPGECPKCGMRLVEQTVPDAGASPPRKSAPGPAKTGPAPAAKVYTCPMHPEVRQPQPGRCPKCGMKLEPAAEAHGEHR